MFGIFPSFMVKVLKEYLSFFPRNRTFFFFASIGLSLSENRSLLFEIKIISENAEIGVYEIYANCQKH